jgi:DNA-binding CsgD family transcriptional regulator
MADPPVARGHHRRGPGRDAARQHHRIALLEDLRKLSPRQRAVLVLRYLDDLTETDTAAALGISVGTVKAHARDALATLRNQTSDVEQSATTRTHGPQHARDQAHPARQERTFRVTRYRRICSSSGTLAEANIPPPRRRSWVPDCQQ